MNHAHGRLVLPVVLVLLVAFAFFVLIRFVNDDLGSTSVISPRITVL
jgi:hypothetical protein